MPRITVKVDNYGFNLTFTISEDDGETPKVLTGYTITLKVWALGGDALKFSGACVITDAANGVCTYLVVDGDFDTEGEYEGELELTAAGIVEDTRTFRIRVFETSP